ncbi:DUF2062 domain-containing protein [Sinimarinibacterium thermocellulolyticum]|uniref:DUF2062 domain-containing protein n=1 Tax=Sinimarinibacterium thermocellulolyticum TaxID=3170016 RepID=A0ABV2A8L0_9GAMM
MSSTAEQAQFGGFWQRRVVAPIVGQLKQGITPEKIALTLALGAVLGIFPILGSTTILCALVGIWLKLNQPVIQLVNYFMYPLQIALLLPFYRAGESLFGQPHVPIFSVNQLTQRFQASPMQFMVDYGMVGVYGIVVWALVAPPLIAALYYGTRPLLRALARRSQ